MGSAWALGRPLFVSNLRGRSAQACNTRRGGGGSIRKDGGVDTQPTRHCFCQFDGCNLPCWVAKVNIVLKRADGPGEAKSRLELRGAIIQVANQIYLAVRVLAL